MLKLQKGKGLNESAMRPNIWNIGTINLLNSLLGPLGKSERSILNTEILVNQVKRPKNTWGLSSDIIWRKELVYKRTLK